MGAAAVFRPDSWEILHDIVQILFFFFLLLPNSSGWRILDAWLQLNLSSTWRSRVSPAPPPQIPESINWFSVFDLFNSFDLGFHQDFWCDTDSSGTNFSGPVDDIHMTRKSREQQQQQRRWRQLLETWPMPGQGWCNVATLYSRKETGPYGVLYLYLSQLVPLPFQFNLTAIKFLENLTRVLWESSENPSRIWSGNSESSWIICWICEEWSVFIQYYQHLTTIL